MEDEQQAPPGVLTLDMTDLMLRYARVSLERDWLRGQVKATLPEGQMMPEPAMSVEDLLVRYGEAQIKGELLEGRCQQLQRANDALLAAQNAPAEMPTPILPLVDDLEFREDTPSQEEMRPAKALAAAGKKNGRA